MVERNLSYAFKRKWEFLQEKVGSGEEDESVDYVKNKTEREEGKGLRQWVISIGFSHGLPLGKQPEKRLEERLGSHWRAPWKTGWGFGLDLVLTMRRGLPKETITGIQFVAKYR